MALVAAGGVDEVDYIDLPVAGLLPPELCGRYFRNGPNPLPGENIRHLLIGPGMLHGVRLRDGRAKWYRNRWTSPRQIHWPPVHHQRAPAI